MGQQHNAEYQRRRKIAEDKIAAEGLMPEEPFVTGPVRLALHEQLVREHMPPAGDAYVYTEPERQPEPTDAEVAAALRRPRPLQDPLKRFEAMADAIGDEMAEADRVRRGEPADETS